MMRALRRAFRPGTIDKRGNRIRISLVWDENFHADERDNPTVHEEFACIEPRQNRKLFVSFDRLGYMVVSAREEKEVDSIAAAIEFIRAASEKR